MAAEARHQRPFPLWAIMVAAVVSIMVFLFPDKTVIVPLIENTFELNPTSSMPRGLYRKQRVVGDVAKGDEVLFCTTADVINRGKGVGIEFPPGTCPTGDGPLLKRVVATAGDTVDTTHHNLIVNGNPVPLSTQQSSRNLVVWPNLITLRLIPPGIFHVPHGQAWGISEELHGYDSRYYGAFHPLYRVVPLIVWKHRDAFPTVNWSGIR